MAAPNMNSDAAIRASFAGRVQSNHKLLKAFLNVKPADAGIIYMYDRENSKDKPKHTQMGPNNPPDPAFKIEGKKKSELRTFLYQGELQTGKIPSKVNLKELQDLAEAKLAQLHAQWIPPVGEISSDPRQNQCCPLLGLSWSRNP
ncbi:hypothetical protein PSHT_14568 [Puccinia striiformis]|uniref:Uncharacterized protein n=1 Tax=Puccinia striiformis TaxID=27350 RepID=A0A2S4UJI8_9BASI|nr:hypothetical protein PSHT_14568 [Puccinia striiformis]